MSQNVMFSGGIPADDAEGVFTLLSESIGDRAISWPDGETTPGRSGWIIGVNQRVLTPAVGVEAVNPEGDEMMNNLRIAPGAKIDLKGQLPYADDAIDSYRVFSRMKNEGQIPEDTLFQVSVPGAHDAISASFSNVSEWDSVFTAWQDALQDEYRRILEVIPAEELCIQIDYCTEMVHIGGTWKKYFPWVGDISEDEAQAKYTSADYIQDHLAGIPDEVRVGYHICCGTWPQYPCQPIDTIDFPVQLANAIQQAAGDRVNYFHLPALPDSGDDFFAPLTGLDTGDAAIYLGIEVNDGLEELDRRAASARKFLPEFGVAHYCGYFWNKEIMPQLLNDLAYGADHQAAATAN